MFEYNSTNHNRAYIQRGASLGGKYAHFSKSIFNILISFLFYQ